MPAQPSMFNRLAGFVNRQLRARLTTAGKVRTMKPGRWQRYIERMTADDWRIMRPSLRCAVLDRLHHSPPPSTIGPPRPPTEAEQIAASIQQAQINHTNAMARVILFSALLLGSSRRH